MSTFGRQEFLEILKNVSTFGMSTLSTRLYIILIVEFQNLLFQLGHIGGEARELKISSPSEPSPSMGTSHWEGQSHTMCHII